MTIQKYPMVTVKEAAAALGVDERTVREKLSGGQIRGEKKLVGLKEKWFVYRGEVEALIEKQRLPRYGESLQAQGTETHATTFDASPAVEAETINIHADGEPDGQDSGGPTFVEWQGHYRDSIKQLAEDLMQPLVARLEAQVAALREKDDVIADQARQLRLLPDLEKRADSEHKAAELNALEAEALKKQITALQEQLEQKVDPEIRRELEDELKAKDGELEVLKQQLVTLEAERQKSEVLEARVTELQQSKLELEKSMQDEIERLRQEKEAQSQAVQDQLLMVSKKLEKMEQPWWKRWFGTQDREEG